MAQDRMPLVVGSEHIDQYNHVNYKAVPGILEPFQDEFLSSRGTSFDEIEKRFGLRSVVKKLEVVWSGELKEGDKCEVATELMLGRTSMTFTQVVTKFDSVVLTLTMVVVMVDATGKSAPLPGKLREQLS